MVAENDQIRLEITKPVYKRPYELNWASQVALVVKNLPANAGDIKTRGFHCWVRKIPWRRARQFTLVFFF